MLVYVTAVIIMCSIVKIITTIRARSEKLFYIRPYIQAVKLYRTVRYTIAYVHGGIVRPHGTVQQSLSL
jgi:hypothetical protein